jgi:hypothetical protein
MQYTFCLFIIRMKEIHTPQRGTDAVPAWGPPSEMKFLTC